MPNCRRYVTTDTKPSNGHWSQVSITTYSLHVNVFIRGTYFIYMVIISGHRPNWNTQCHQFQCWSVWWLLIQIIFLCKQIKFKDGIGSPWRSGGTANVFRASRLDLPLESSEQPYEHDLVWMCYSVYIRWLYGVIVLDIILYYLN